tara:strand:+ start:1530 stop:1763 length:234 start_codon:yes stop_codon:yes gene_type:complete
MARMKTKDEKRRMEFPSDYGSHASMIDQSETEDLNDPKRVVLRDNHGTYTTERHRLDNGMADPNRYSSREIQIPLEE